MKRVCPRCEGSGRCTDCQGEGFVLCVSCRGTGQRQSSRGSSYPCRTCQGSGKTTCQPECSSCEGSGEITEALQRRVRDKYELKFEQLRSQTAVTFTLLILCTLLYLSGTIKVSLNNWLQANLSNISVLFMSQPWRLLTYAFLHANFWHLCLNMLALLRLGPPLESLYGSQRYTIAILITAISGGLLSAMAHQEASIMSLGFSGVIFGLIGLFSGGYARYHLFPWLQVRDLLTSIIIWVVVSYSWSAAFDHWCHLGGFLAGFAYAWLTRCPDGRRV